jgi:hypothetical protein
MTHIFCGLEHLLRMWCGVFITIRCRDLIIVFTYLKIMMR